MRGEMSRGKEVESSGASAATDWGRIRPAPGATSPWSPPDPATCRSVAAADVRILREDELDELRRLRDECEEWLSWNRNPLQASDRRLVAAIRRARRFTMGGCQR